MRECSRLAAWILSQHYEIRRNMSALPKRGCSVHSFFRLNNSMQPGNSCLSSILCTRCTSRRSAPRLRMRMHSWTHSKALMRRFVRCRATSISCRLVILKCFYRTKQILHCWRKRGSSSVICQFFGKRRRKERSKPLRCWPNTTPMRSRQRSVTNCAPAE